MSARRPAVRALAAGAAIVTGVGLAGVTAAPAVADEFTVTTAEALADAIDDANISPGGDIITIDGAITLTADLPAIATDLELRGAGNTLDADGFGGISIAAGTTVTISDLTIENTAGPGILTTSAEVELDRVSVTLSGGNGLEATGGDITVTDSTFSENDASGAMIDSSGRIVVSGSTFLDNLQSGLVVQVRDPGSLSATGSLAEGNTTAGMEFFGSGNSMLTLEGLDSIGNGEGFVVSARENSTVDGIRLLAEANDNGGFELSAFDGATVVVVDSASNGNFGDGVGIESLDFSTVTVTDFDAIGNGSDGYDIGDIGTEAIVTVVEATIAANGSSGLEVGDALGGGVMALERSTVSGNDGMGIGGVVLGESRFTIRNSTVSGNGGFGACVGGIDVIGVADPQDPPSDGRFELVHSTVWDNGTGVCPQVATAMLGSAFISHSIIAGTGSDLGAAGGHPITVEWSILGSPLDPPFSTPNLDAAVAGPTNLIADPLLGPLADNGGPTETHLLLAGSPAIGGGDPELAGAPEVDQRGFDRIAGSAIDIGAVEMPAEDDPIEEDPDEEDPDEENPDEEGPDEGGPGEDGGAGSPAALPQTGAESTGIAAAALLLLVAGGLALGARRMLRI